MDPLACVCLELWRFRQKKWRFQAARAVNISDRHEHTRPIIFIQYKHIRPKPESGCAKRRQYFRNFYLAYPYFPESYSA
jgi:hypothetical protein